MTQDITETLEAMIDKHSLLHVLTGLQLVCDEKAEHLRSNWQDTISAKVWEQDSNKITKILNQIQN